jgi:N-acetylated-alpha-linked acidic dipeptidase
MTAERCLGALVVAGLAGAAFAGVELREAQPRDSTAERRLGFTASAFAMERGVERRFLEGLSATRISDVHRALTARPHRSGTAGARDVAEFVRTTLRRAGLEVEVTEYLAFLSEPQRVQIDIVSPERIALATREPSDERDRTSNHPGLDPGFVAYSASGDVTASVVNANYGLPADYERLKADGIDVRGRIVLVRYGRSHRAVKVYTAEQAGAAAVLLYSDPADDGAARGAVWPEGLWRAPHFIQRGNAKYSWFWHGDPLTPGVPATAKADTLDPKAAPTLPKVPVAVVSAAEAQKVLSRLGAGVTLRMQIAMASARRPIRNVIGRIRGGATPERLVILGTHHDAWTFGGIDPGSSAAVLLHVAERLAAMREAGWQPSRTMLFAFWDAEEYGLVGSTEYAEDRARELQDRAVVYINSDMYTPGRLVAGGVPSLRDFVFELARDVGGSAPSARSAPSAPAFAAGAATAGKPELSPLGSGADFVAFQDHLGISTLALEYLFEGGYGFGAYHSSYDSRDYMERVGDPGFKHGVALAQLLGVGVMRLASAPLLPFRPSHYADQIAAFLKEAEAWPASARTAVVVNTGELQAIASTIADLARGLESSLDRTLAEGRVPTNAAAINDGLMRLERTLVDASESADKRWYRHVIYGWNIYSMYDGQPLPGLFEAIRVGDAAAIARELARTRAALERMRQAITEMAVLLK